MSHFRKYRKVAAGVGAGCRHGDHTLSGCRQCDQCLHCGQWLRWGACSQAHNALNVSHVARVTTWAHLLPAVSHAVRMLPALGAGCGQWWQGCKGAGNGSM